MTHVPTKMSKMEQMAELLGTTDKNAIISACILTLTNNGFSAGDAFDMVFGGGSFDKLASDLHAQLNA